MRSVSSPVTSASTSSRSSRRSPAPRRESCWRSGRSPCTPAAACPTPAATWRRSAPPSTWWATRATTSWAAAGRAPSRARDADRPDPAARRALDVLLARIRAGRAGPLVLASRRGQRRVRRHRGGPDRRGPAPRRLPAAAARADRRRRAHRWRRCWSAPGRPGITTSLDLVVIIRRRLRLAGLGAPCWRGCCPSSTSSARASTTCELALHLDAGAGRSDLRHAAQMLLDFGAAIGMLTPRPGGLLLCTADVARLRMPAPCSASTPSARGSGPPRSTSRHRRRSRCTPRSGRGTRRPPASSPGCSRTSSPARPSSWRRERLRARISGEPIPPQPAS